MARINLFIGFWLPTPAALQAIALATDDLFLEKLKAVPREN